MVRDKDVAGVAVDFLQTLGAHANEADGEQDPGPGARDLVWNPAAAVEERRQQRKRAHHDRRERDQRRREQNGSQIAHRVAPIITARASATRKRDPVTKIASGWSWRAVSSAALISPAAGTLAK